MEPQTSGTDNKGYAETKLDDVHIQMDTAVKHSGYELKFTDLCVKIGKREILKDVYGMAKPGEMVAIMGPSGAGKTTLLNCLAGRQAIESGSLFLNSRPINKQLMRKVSYVLQHDIFLENLTCWETLWYTALLRLPGSMPTSEKKERVMDIVDTLDMKKCLHTKIGGQLSRGLSGGEIKRTTIACELLTNPALMLLDEPTSGLDSSNAFSLCTILKQFAKDSGKTVVTSIHQPSSQIFNMFDKLLLLCDGKMAYFGEVKNCAQHFASLELPCPAHFSLADHILSQVSGSLETQEKLIEAAKYHGCHKNALKAEMGVICPKAEVENLGYVENGNIKLSIMHTDSSTEKECNVATTSQCNGTTSEKRQLGVDLEYTKYQREYNSIWPTSFIFQFYVLFCRSIKYSFPRFISKSYLGQMVFLSAFIGALWFQVDAAEREITNRQGLMFLFIVLSSMPVFMDAIVSMMGDQFVVNKERLAGYYRLSSYWFAKSICDILYHWLIAVLYFTIGFLLSGVSRQFTVYLQMLAVLCLNCVVHYTLGEFFMTCFTSYSDAISNGLTLLMVYMIGGGFYVTNIPFWMSWLQYISTMLNCFYILLSLDYSNTEYRCDSVNSLYPSCKINQSALSFTNQSGFSPTNQSEVIKYISTEELLTTNTLAAEGWTMYHHILVLIGYVVILKLITYLLLRLVRKPQ